MEPPLAREDTFGRTKGYEVKFRVLDRADDKTFTVSFVMSRAQFLKLRRERDRNVILHMPFDIE
jgi:hypothetical protein